VEGVDGEAKVAASPSTLRTVSADPVHGSGIEHKTKYDLETPVLQTPKLQQTRLRTFLCSWA
jgi:hypothetical protein